MRTWHSPVKLSIGDNVSFAGDCFKKQDSKVEIETITLTPSGDQSLVKPTRTATEVDNEIEALVKLKKKDGTGAVTEIPIKIDWRFEDPDDTATSPGIDSNGATGDDNAPVANGGKLGTGSLLWKAVAGFTTNIAADGQTADSQTMISGADKGKTKIRFSASAIGGDNYILVTQCKDAGGTVLKEEKSGTWSLRKVLTFQQAFQMIGGEEVTTVMATTNIDPAFSGDGYTDYTLGVVNSVLSGGSPEFIAALLAPNPSETPTAQELADYADPNPAINGPAGVSITAKASAWYQRNQTNFSASLQANASLIGATAPAVVGARYLSPKEDGRVSTTNFYPLGIMITTNEGQTVDPDDDWFITQGIENGDIAWIFLTSPTPARRQEIGRHEAGHASDHEPFGTGDHAASALMHPFTQSNMFSDDSILRLRGWRP